MNELTHIGYDLESYPNIFTCCIGDTRNETQYVYEISSRKNEFNLLLQALLTIKQQGIKMVGYNNIGYDYPMLHFLLTNATAESSTMAGEDLAYAMWQKNEEIFATPYGSFTSVYESDVILPQLDLSKVNHFDNANRRTSLKCLEFKMRSMSIQDLPFPPGIPLAESDMDALIEYNIKDVKETVNFFNLCLPAIEFRAQLSEQLGMDCTNFNDTKIGEQFFIKRLEAELGPDICYTMKGRKKIKNQSPRAEINLGEVLDPRVAFVTPEFIAIHEWIKGQTITETKGSLLDIDMLDPSSSSLLPFLPDIQAELLEVEKQKNLFREKGEPKKSVKKVSKRTQVTHLQTGEILYTYSNEGSAKRIKDIKSEYPEDQLEFKIIKHTLPKLCVPFYNSTDMPDGEHVQSRLGDLLMVYGLGGLHASVNNKAIHSNEEWVIIDADVTGYYVNNIITINAYPEHIGPYFVQGMADMSNERSQYSKGTTENSALKLSGNGVFGKTNDAHSPFYDPKCTMKITLNGQMFLTILIERLKETLGPDVELIQANTDGITCLVKRRAGEMFSKICNDWCQFTSLKLEYAAYDHMYIRDVNNYLAITQQGKIKAVGKYADPVPSESNPKGDWAKNHSQLVVYKTVQAKLRDPSLDVEALVRNHEDLFDFMFYIKAGGRNFLRLEMHYTETGYEDPQVIQKRSRFLVTKTGGRLCNVFKAGTADDPKERRVGEKSKHLVTLCNDVTDEFLAQVRDHIDYDYYINEVNNLLKLEEVHL